MCSMELMPGAAGAPGVTELREVADIGFLRSVITKIDLDGPSLCAYNPVHGGVIFNESEITVQDAPGLGIRTIDGLEPIVV